MATGMIGEELTHNSDLGMQSVSLCEDTSMDVTDAPRVSLVAAEAAGQPDSEVEVPAAAVSPPPPPDPDDPDPPDPADPVESEPPNSFEQPGSPAAPAEETAAKDEPKRRDRLAEVCDEPKAPLADPWEPITPQETDERAPPPNKKRAPKPIKRGRTTKLPPGFDALKSAGKSRHCKF